MRVTGYVDGVLYTVETDPAVAPTETRGIIVNAPDTLVARLSTYVGEEVSVTPVGPSVTGTFDTDTGVLGLLMALTEVVAVGDGPDLLNDETSDNQPKVH